MCSPWSTIQFPNGTSCLTHSTLRTSHRRLVGCSIQTVYETIAHDSRTRKGAAINRRRRRRLRLTAGPPGRSPRAAPPARDAGTGGESAASGGALTPEPEPDRRRPLHPITSKPRSSKTRQRNDTPRAMPLPARGGGSVAQLDNLKAIPEAHGLTGRGQDRSRRGGAFGPLGALGLGPVPGEVRWRVRWLF